MPRTRLAAPDGKTEKRGAAGLSAPHAGRAALIASSYLADVNTRRVRRALAALFGVRSATTR